MKQQITKMFLLLLIGTMTYSDVLSQCATTVLANNGSTSGNGRCPNARFRNGRGVYLISAAEMAASGMFNGQTVTGIGWLNSVASGVVAPGTLILYLQNTSDVSNTKSTTWTSAISGMTIAHNGAFTLPNALQMNLTAFSGGSPFTYTGGGVYVAFDWAYCAGTLSAAQTILCNTAGSTLSSQQNAGACATITTLVAGSLFRPDTRFYAACINNDARVTNIYTTGSLPNSYTTNHVMQAIVTNPGLNALSNLAVTLNITGANTFSDVQNIVSLASGGTAVVTFAAFTPTTVGNNTVSVSVPADDNNTNNTLTMTQEITTDYFSYRYQGVGNSGGVGFNGGTGQFSGMFNTALSAFVQEVQVDFTTSGLPFRMAIYGDAGGVPGTQLYEDAATRTTAIGTAFITLGSNVSIPAGKFYVSIEQLGTTNVGFAYTTESPMRSNAFFYTSLPAGAWTDLGPAALPFRFNIRVNLHLPVPPNCAANLSPSNASTGNCLNTVLAWTSGGGAPTGYRLTFGTNSPNYDNILNDVDQFGSLSYNSGVLSPGTTYGYKVVPYNTDGTATGCSISTFTTVASGALPFTEDFSAITFPPTCWSRNDITFVIRNNASTAGVGSAEMDFYNTSNSLELITPIFGNTPAGEVLSFNYAYATFQTEVDQLEILYSTDQGSSFTSLEVLNGGPTGVLNTGGASLTEFVPTTAQWGLHQVVLPAGTNMIKFHGISAFGNDLYLDNVTVASPPTIPNCPINQSPTNASTNVFRDASVTWSDGGGASFFDVFFDLGAGPASTLVSANQAGTSYTPATMAANTQYSYRIVAKNIAGDATGCSDISFTTGTLYDYCNPVHTPGCGNGNITNVTFNTLNNTTTCNPPASQNFPVSGSTTTSVDKGSSYNLSVTCDVSCIISVWIDWNHDGTFAPSEWTQVATASTANVADVVSIPVPISALPGLTGMRIRSRFALNPNGDVDACSVFGSGEAEDYYITINCAGSASSNSPICNHSTLNLTSGPTGATFSWTGPASYTSAAQNPSLTNATLGTNNGTYAVNISSTGCNENINVPVTINALPSVAPTASAPFCEGTANLNLAANAPTATSFNWTGPGSITNGNTANASVNNAPASASGTYNVAVSDANGCNNNANVSATVYALPPVLITPIGSTNLCTGQTTTDLQASGASTYSWSTTETTSLITVSTQGNYSVTGIDGNGCVNTDVQAITESTPPSVPIISPAGPIVLCTDGFTTTSVNLSVTNYATSLLWSTSETTQSIGVNYADNFNVTYSDGNGCYSVSNTVTTSVDNYSTAPTGASSNAAFNNICLGSNVTLSVVGGSLGDNSQWKWYEGGCGSGTSIASGASPTITPATGGTHHYFVRSESVSCGNTPCASIDIVVSTIIPAGTVHITATPSSGCQGGTGVVSVNAVAGASYYSWSGAGCLFNGNPPPFRTTVPTVTVSYGILPAGQSGYQVCVFPGNACGQTNTICTWIRAQVSQPGVITPGSGNPVACPNGNGTYSIVPVPSADTYTWTISGGNATIVGGTSTLTTASNSITINFGAGWTSGTLSVYASLNCSFNSAARTLALSNTPVMPGSMVGTTYPCPSASTVYSIAAVPGAASYNWTCLMPGVILTPSGISCSILFPSTIPAGYQVCVTAVSSCGNASPARCRGVANGLPNTPGNISGPASGQCGQGGVSYTISPVSGATGYLWTAIAGGTIIPPNNLSGVSVNFSSTFVSSTISVSATNACGTGGARSLLVYGTPATPPSISGNNCVHTGNIEPYGTPGSAGATGYNWAVPAGSTILGGQGGANITVQWGATGGTVNVTASNDCGVSGTRTYPVVTTCRQAQVEATIASGNVTLYPNPTSDKVTLSFNSPSSQNLGMNVTDLLGRNVLTENLKAEEGANLHEVNLSSLAKGIYLIHLNGENMNEVVKVTVE